MKQLFFHETDKTWSFCSNAEAHSSLLSKIGSDATLFLNRVIFWLKKCPKDLDGTFWIYNSLDQWHSQFSFWSLSKLRRIIKKLEDKNILISKKVNAHKWNHTKWYSVNIVEMRKLIPHSKKSSLSFCNESTKKPDVDIFFDQWNQKIETSPIKLSPDRRKKICRVLERHFSFSLEKWNVFLSKISNSDFLSGKISSFKASFDWATRETNLLKILDGKYDNKEKKRKKEKNEQIDMSILNRSLEDTKYNKTKDSPSISPQGEESKVKTKKFFDLWNEKLEKTPITFSSRREKKLRTVISKHFSNSLEQWSKFLDKILASKFLRGEVTSFRASFDWSIREANILKIVEGNYQNRGKEAVEISSNEPESLKTEEIEQEINKQTGEWQNILRELVKDHGVDTYKSWFSKIRVKYTENSKMLLLAPTKFIKDWLEVNYQRKIERLLARDSLSYRVYFAVE